MDKLTQISLFTGCGGIDLAFERAGFESLLQVEIDKHARSVLERHWPSVERIEDVRDVCKDDKAALSGRSRDMGQGRNGANDKQFRPGRVENVGVDGIGGERPDSGSGHSGASDRPKGPAGQHPTVIHFGSPCQDLSVAGKRKGLSGDRSGLFSEAARIVREFDPDFAIWENVDGAFSSNGGRDFQSVLSHLAEAYVPMPRSGKWARAGMVRGNGVEVAWRTLDAQFFTVAQRRTRVFVVVDRRAQRAGEILFERTSLSGNTPPSGAPREEVAAGLRSRSSNPGVNMPGRGGEDDSNLVIAGFMPGAGAKAGSIGFQPEQSPTLRAVESGTMTPAVVAIKLANTKQNGSPIGREVAFTLDGTQQAIARPLLAKGNSSHDATLETYIPDTAVPLGSHHTRANVELETYIPDVSYPLGARDHKGPSSSADQAQMNAPVQGVRRLTPTECERLQGMPDGWTELAADGTKISDTQRFKMLGNSVAVPVLEWIATRMAAVAEQG